MAIIMVLLAGLLFSALGLYILFPAVRGIILGSKSRYWPLAKGSILESSVKSGVNKNFTRSYWADVTYRYWINGKSYTGTNIGFALHGTKLNSSLKRDEAQKIVSALETGKLVNIYHHPNHYSISVIYPGFNWASFVQLLIAIVFFATGLWFMTIIFMFS